MSTSVSDALQGPGWIRFPVDRQVLAWAGAARRVAERVLVAPDGEWRCGGTWFPGVDALPNKSDGSIEGVALPPVLAAAVPTRPAEWHAAQLSVLRLGYPQPWSGENEAAFNFRSNRDAAHVDGLLPVGPERRRMIREPHGFILGIPLTDADPAAAPLVVWEGSQAIIRRAFADALAGHPASHWSDVDLTDIYQEARREVFATCRRLELPTRPGEALLLHRLVLHGMAPWQDGAHADPIGRAIAYFRPELPSVSDWLAEG